MRSRLRATVERSCFAAHLPRLVAAVLSGVLVLVLVSPPDASAPEASPVAPAAAAGIVYDAVTSSPASTPHFGCDDSTSDAPSTPTSTNAAGEPSAPTAVFVAADSAAAGASSSIRVVEESIGVIEYEASTPAGKLSIIADVSKTDDTLTLNNFDIDGPGRNSLGTAGLRGLAQQLGRQEGVSQVVIRGAPRTTGPNPGSVSRAITIKVDP